MDATVNGRDGAGRRTAVVVGGGIGGLTCAAALGARGWAVDVVERARGFADVGSGLSLWPNGVRALDTLGLGDELRARAMPGNHAGVRDVSGRWLSRTDVAELTRLHGPLVTIHRADLHDILRGAVSGGVHTGVEVRQVRSDGPLVEVVHREGLFRADLVVGADGIHSTVRRSLWPDARRPRYAGYTAWRFVVDPGRALEAGGETWGRGKRLGILPLADGRVYVFGVANAPEGQRSTDGELAEMRRCFAGWHDPIPALLDAVPQDAVSRHDIYDLPRLRTFVRDRVALLGDAAHAMTPDLGQGANQALEDAVTLAAVLDRHPDTATALAAYDRARRGRTQSIVRRSRRLGSVAQWSSAPATALRDGLLRLTPSRSVLRSLRPVLAWQPPT